MNPLRRQHGFSAIEIVIAVVVLAGIGAAVYVAITNFSRNRNQGLSYNQPITGNKQGTPSPSAASGATVLWEADGSGNWRAMGTAPSCPAQPMLKTPTAMDNVTAILYPGQTRGGNYKPHGGFRFDHATNNDVTVAAAMDGTVVRGSRYTELGQTQYMFDIVNSCGVMYRYDHLRTLTSKFQTLADKFPPASADDSRTNRVDPGVTVKTGDPVATAVGFTGNVSFDFGVYDLRAPNAKAADATYTQRYGLELAGHAVCWFDWLPAADAAKAKALPASDPASGKTSDYCKS